MSTKIIFPVSNLILIFILFTSSCTTITSTSTNSSSCPPSVCGNVKDIRYPFRLKGDPKNCGESGYQLDCLNNHTVITLKNSKQLYVQSITYYNFTIRLVDPGFINPSSNRNCSLPVNSAVMYDDIPSLTYNNFLEYNLPVVFITCTDPISNSESFVDISFCNKTRNGYKDYVGVQGDRMLLSDLPESCAIEKVTAMSNRVPLMDNTSLVDIHQGLAYGFELSWYRVHCSECIATHGFCSLESNIVTCKHYCYEDTPVSQLGFRCRVEFYAPIVIAISILAIGGLLTLRFLIGLVCLTVLIIRKWRRRHLSADETSREQCEERDMKHVAPPVVET